MSKCLPQSILTKHSYAKLRFSFPHCVLISKVEGFACLSVATASSAFPSLSTSVFSVFSVACDSYQAALGSIRLLSGRLAASRVWANHLRGCRPNARDSERRRVRAGALKNEEQGFQAHSCVDVGAVHRFRGRARRPATADYLPLLGAAKYCTWLGKREGLHGARPGTKTLSRPPASRGTSCRCPTATC